MTAIIEDADAIRVELGRLHSGEGSCAIRDGLDWYKCRTCGSRPCFLALPQPQPPLTDADLSELTITPWFREIRL